MAGTKIGGQRARDVNLAKDPDFYHKIGKLGGAAGKGHKFGHGKVDPSVIGKIGGQRSRKPKLAVQEEIEKFQKASFYGRWKRS